MCVSYTKLHYNQSCCSLFVLFCSAAILEVGVVAMPDTKWQEVPCAFVALKPQYLPSAATTEGVKPEKAPTEKELIAWCRTKMARYMAPKKIVFTELPKTTTGKIQKNVLRDIVRKW